MHRNTLILTMIVVLVCSLGLGCAKKKVETEPGAAGAQTSASQEGAAGADGMTEAERQALKEKELAEKMEKAKVTLTEETIYFDYDEFDLKPEAREKLKKKADALTMFPNFRVLVEGHCDERGTEEYNLALGERRARAAYEFLVLLGVKPTQLEIVSYGEEYPAVAGSTEAAWAKNRRAEFKIIK